MLTDNRYIGFKTNSISLANDNQIFLLSKKKLHHDGEKCQK